MITIFVYSYWSKHLDEPGFDKTGTFILYCQSVRLHMNTCSVKRVIY